MPEKIKKYPPFHIPRSLRRFPATLSAIWLFTFVFTGAFMAQDNERITEKILLFLFYFGSGSFLAESLLLNRNGKKRYGIAMVLNLILSVLFWFLSRIGNPAEWEASAWITLVFRYTAAYFLICFLSGVWLCYRRLSCSLEVYLTRVFGRAVRYHLIWFLLMAGISLMVGILQILFHLSWDIHIEMQMLLFGLYYMSSFLLCFYPENIAENSDTCVKEPEDGFIGVLIKYVLSGMIIISCAIIYCYLLKILVLCEIPSNSIFRITAQLFVIGTPVCLMASSYRENYPLRRIMQMLPYLFLPFLPLQIYSIGIRLWKNGVTPMRYAAIVFLIFECIFLAGYRFRRDKLHMLLPLLAAFILAAVFLPFVNMNTLSCFSQKAAVNRFLALPEEEQTKIARIQNHDNDASLTPEQDEHYRQLRDRYGGAYSFLRYDYLGRQYLDTLSESDTQRLDALLSYNDYDTDPFSTHYHTSASTDKIPVEGYRYCYPVEAASYRDSYHDLDGVQSKRDFLANYPLLSDQKPGFTIDLGGLFTYYMEQADSNGIIGDAFATQQLYETDENHVLYLETISFTYDSEANYFIDFRMDGYLLEK